MLGLPTFALVFTLSVIVALPSILAIVRKHPRWLPITIVDILFGWTIVGWIAALVWVLRPVKARKPRVKKPVKLRSAAAKKPAANDNLSELVAADAMASMPAPVDPDVYGEWLERGAALGEDEESSEDAGRTAAHAVPSAASGRVAA